MGTPLPYANSIASQLTNHFGKHSKDSPRNYYINKNRKKYEAVPTSKGT